MTPIRRAVIDVGTNSVKLLIADVTGQSVNPVHEESRQTRLGHGSYATRILQPSAIENTACVTADFAEKARELRSQTVRVLATSAARDAVNASELVAAILRKAGLQLEIISGELEAQWAFAGISSDPRLAGHSLLIMDAGGGSTQLIYGPLGGEPARHSFRVGAVRLLEKFPTFDPPDPRELEQCLDWLRRYLREHTPQTLKPTWIEDAQSTPRFVGTGGSSSLLAAMQLGINRFDREKIEGVELSEQQVAQRLRQLWSLPLEERRKIPGLPANKADVILMGTAIHAAVMAAYSVSSMVISTRGFRFAALIAGSA
jgi:exopolyphosphatase / guanosine-5'-triphosphate,3'-diphosphate pyrophosphatase